MRLILRDFIILSAYQQEMEFLREQEMKLFSFDKICRFCLSEEQMAKPLFYDGDVDRIADKVMYCFSIEVHKFDRKRDHINK